MQGMSIGGLCLSSVSGLGFAPYGRVLNVRDDDGMQMVSASEYPYDDYGVPEYRWAELTHIPDLTDPATLGCLLTLAREAWVSTTVYARPTKTTWIVMMGSGKGFGKVSEAGSEAEALVAALEAAHKRGEHRREEGR